MADFQMQPTHSYYHTGADRFMRDWTITGDNKEYWIVKRRNEDGRLRVCLLYKDEWMRVDASASVYDPEQPFKNRTHEA